MKNLLIVVLLMTFPLIAFNQKINKSKVVRLNSFVGKYEVKIGQVVSYTGSHHASVGVSFYIDEDKIFLKFLQKEIEYEQDQEKAGNGGDAASVTFYYEVIKEGETEIHIKEDFRGETRSEYDIKLTITK